MPFEPVDIWAAIRGHHLKLLSDWQAQLLAAHVYGLSIRECAEVFGFSQQHIRGQLERIEDLICEPLGLKRHLGIAARWFTGHLDCCLTHAKTLIENSSVFPRKRA